MSDWHEDVLRHKYDPLPEEPTPYRKKSKKKRVRSDHKHDYERIVIDAHTFVHRNDVRIPLYHTGKRCKVCGRLASTHMEEVGFEPPDDMPLYEVKDYLDFMCMRYLPEEMRVR